MTYRQSASSLGRRASPDRGQDGDELGASNGLPIPPVGHAFTLYPATPGPSSKPSKPRVLAFLLREFQRVACELRAVSRAWTIYSATTYTSRGMVEMRISKRKEVTQMMWGNGSMGWSWGFGLLAIAGVAVLIYVIVRFLSNKSASDDTRSAPRQADSASARRILEERFARGELTAEQLRDQLRVLEEGR